MECIIAQAESTTDILRCYPVMAQLRPHLEESAFLERVLLQQQAGYRLAYLESGGEVRAVAGYRYSDCLAYGHFCYVDDLVADAKSRSQGFGRALFDWLVARAREEGCVNFSLDSGVQRFDAHRFYLARRLAIVSHHFNMPLQSN